LADRVLDKLIEEKVLRDDDRKKYAVKMANGQMTGEDWRLAIELSAVARAKG
jgi:hypothetical protein